MLRNLHRQVKLPLVIPYPRKPKEMHVVPAITPTNLPADPAPVAPVAPAPAAPAPPLRHPPLRHPPNLSYRHPPNLPLRHPPLRLLTNK